MTDPNGWVSQPPSTMVKVVNTSRAALNGQLGIVLAYQTDRGRYVVLTTGAAQEQVSLKPENLIKASWFEQLKAQYELMQNNPQVRQQLRTIYTQVQRTTGVKPEYVGGAAVVLLLAAVYFLGFSRTLLILSTLLMVFIMVLPDLQAGTPLPQLVRNVPMRFRALVRQNVPVVGDRIANSNLWSGVVAAVLVFFFVNALVGGQSSKAVPPPPAVGTTVPPPVATSRALLEDYYKKGFDDATAGLEFGTSLPATTPQGADAPADFAWPGSQMPPPPPPAPSALSKLMNWSSLVSLFIVGNTVFSAGRTADGGWDPQLCFANLRLLDPWKMGMLALSVYRLVAPFFS